MRKYELVIIFLATLEKAGLEKILDKIKKIIAEAGGKAVEVKEWGKRELTYPIKKQKQGIYYLLNFELEGKEAKKIEEKIKIEGDILRHLLVRNTQGVNRV